MQEVSANTAVRMITRYWRRNRPSARSISAATPPDPASSLDAGPVWGMRVFSAFNTLV